MPNIINGSLTSESFQVSSINLAKNPRTDPLTTESHKLIEEIRKAVNERWKMIEYLKLRVATQASSPLLNNLPSPQQVLMTSTPEDLPKKGQKIEKVCPDPLPEQLGIDPKDGEIADLQDVVKTVKDELSKKSQLLSFSENSRSELTAENHAIRSAAQSHIDRQAQKIKELEDKIEKRETELSRLEGQRKVLHENSLKSQQEILYLQDVIRTFRDELSKKSQLLNFSENSRSRLTAENHAIRSNAQSHISEQAQKIKELEDMIGKRDAELSNLEGRLKVLDERSLKSENDLVGQTSSLKEELSHEKEKNKQLLQQYLETIQKLYSEKSSQSYEIGRLVNQVLGYEEKILELESHIEEEKKISASKAEAREKYFADLDSEVESLQKEQAETPSENKNFLKELNDFLESDGGHKL